MSIANKIPPETVIQTPKYQTKHNSLLTDTLTGRSHPLFSPTPHLVLP